MKIFIRFFLFVLFLGVSISVRAFECHEVSPLYKKVLCTDPQKIQSGDMQSMEDLKKLIKEYKKKKSPHPEDMAQYLILATVYFPSEHLSDLFKKSADDLHRKIIADFEEEISRSSYIGHRRNYENYLELVLTDPLSCFEKKECLLPALVIPFGFMGMGDIIIPCKEAIETKTVGALDIGGGGHGAGTAALSNCPLDSSLGFSGGLEEYYTFIREFDYVNEEGSKWLFSH
ncbi:MAG: hypothetical protein LBU87_06430 [Lactobacillales bacterium]|jgi:hypothetical protein|nr:hypothetical protein [Lactobacillales bacterium]